ncbi:MAG: NAD kinase [Xanthomonadales bacterium]|nr:NAD kinase [Xanthomonadales bacterium]
MEKISFQASRTEGAQDTLKRLTERYGQVSPEDSDVIVAIGGDGFMLQTMHRNMKLARPIYGLMQGSVGFLMNQSDDERLLTDRLEQSEVAEIHPLRMIARGEAGTELEALAINEVSLFRQTKQAAKIAVWINEVRRLDQLICDGIMLSTPAGSTAYNLSAHGPIIPLGSNILAMTPISPFRPRRWRGALLPCDVRVKFEVLDHYKRPVSATADAFEVRDVVEVEIFEAKDVTLRMLFDRGHNLEERILNEQFAS